MGEASIQEESKPTTPNDFQAYPARYGWPTVNENGYRITEQCSGVERPLKIISVGAGVAGICLAKFLPERLRNVSLTVYDKNPVLGGTWYENRYTLLTSNFREGSCSNSGKDTRDVHVIFHPMFTRFVPFTPCSLYNLDADVSVVFLGEEPTLD